ncbi:crosslink repair DNA glycosylase YcaQ family protein [Streptomyces sp. NPDC006430]|uniref:DNA glycosylase AlkZ-like family protein n=1 Tax=Streptomyces sp. NPDC006430 TaxID=3154299 RepID=UPI0033B5B516
MWDSILLDSADRSRVIPPAYRKHVTRVNGDVLPTLLVDGYVAACGVPSRVESRPPPSIPFQGTWEGLAAEAGALAPFLGA